MRQIRILIWSGNLFNKLVNRVLGRDFPCFFLLAERILNVCIEKSRIKQDRSSRIFQINREFTKDILIVWGRVLVAVVPLERAMGIAVLAGEIMLQNGAETYRVEETVEHIARACGAYKAESFVVPTGVFVTVTDDGGHSLTTMRRIRSRTINLERVAKINEISRQLVEGRMESDQAYRELEYIARQYVGFSLFPSMMASGAVGGSYAVMQGGILLEVVAAFTAALSVRYVAHIVFRLKGVGFAFEFLGGMATAAIGGMVHFLYPAIGRDIIIISGIMPLVPGVAITNAIRDVIAGDLVSSVSKGLEALLTAVAVSMGVVIVLALEAYL